VEARDSSRAPSPSRSQLALARRTALPSWQKQRSSRQAQVALRRPCLPRFAV